MQTTYSRRRTIAALSVILTLAACRGGGSTPAVQAGLDDLVRSEVSDNGFLGTGVTVRLDDGDVVRSAVGHADPEQAADYDVDSTEQVIGSVTKLYTAVLIMQLVEANRFGLDDTVDRWLSFGGAERITVRMLLNHTSGLADFLADMTFEQYGQHWSPEQLLQLALAAGPFGEPGMAQAIYSNTNYLVLAMIVEAETGASWEANLEQRIFQPLGLRHTYFAGDSSRAEHLAGGWMQTEGGWVDTLSFIDPSVGWGVGGMVSTNDELARFTEALFDGELFESPTTLAHMLHFDTPMNPAYLGQDPPSEVGLCITRMTAEGVQLEGHLGHIAGFNAAAVRDSETGEIIVVTSNDDRAYSGGTAFRVALYLRDR